MFRIISLPCVAVLALATSLLGCGGEEADTSGVTTISLSPNPFGVQATNNVQLYVVATMKDGTTKDLSTSDEAHWTTSDTKTALVDEHGMVEGVSPGVAQVTVTYGNMSDTVSCTVTP